jgi:hypothetical protein
MEETLYDVASIGSSPHGSFFATSPLIKKIGQASLANNILHPNLLGGKINAFVFSNNSQAYIGIKKIKSFL